MDKEHLLKSKIHWGGYIVASESEDGIIFYEEGKIEIPKCVFIYNDGTMAIQDKLGFPRFVDINVLKVMIEYFELKRGVKK